MTSRNLENLVRIGSLKREVPNPEEGAALLSSGEIRLADAHREELSYESRFDLGYNASHALALLALRQRGYRSEARYIVFQCLSETLAMSANDCALLARCHRHRNIAEYEGHFEIDEGLLASMLHIATLMLTKLKATLAESGR